MDQVPLLPNTIFPILYCIEQRVKGPTFLPVPILPLGDGVIFGPQGRNKKLA
jgi:hypothetical protein